MIRQDAIKATLALTAALGTYVTAASLSAYFTLKMFPETLPRPPRFCLVDQAMVLGYNGASATLLPLMVLATLPLLRGAGRPEAPLARAALRSVAALMLVGLAMEVAQVVLIKSLAYRPLQALGQTSDVLAVAALAGAALASRPGKALLLDPRWSWRLALFLGVFPGLLASLGRPGFSELVYLWLRLGAAPAGFALFWDEALRGRELKPDTGMLNLLGVILFGAAALFLHYAILFTVSKEGAIQAANVVSLGVISLVALALLLSGVVRLWRREGDIIDRLGACVGIGILACATFPRYQPPWVRGSFGWLMRMSLIPSQAMVGVGLLVGLRVHGWLRRHDPAGGPPAALRITWTCLAVTFLVSDRVSDWIWTYEVWIKQIQQMSDVAMRLRVTSGFELCAALSLLALVPSVRRAVTHLLREAPA